MAENKCVVYEGEHWSALYVDGKLVTVGDHYHADERIRELFGVTTIQDEREPFMLGGNDYNDVAKTLDEVETYSASLTKAHESAEQLRAQADALREQAALLEEQASARQKL